MASTGAGGAGAGAGADHDNDNQKLIAALREETSFLREESSLLKQAIALLQQTQANHWNESTTFYASSHAQLVQGNEIPQNGMPARFVKELIDSVRLCDSRPQLNTGSYVNVVSEPEEREVASMGAEVNLANAAVYPGSINLHDTVVNLLAKLWNAPSEPAIRGGNYVGAGTVGSTEACLLAGLALKFRWRKWYAAHHGLSEDQVQAIKPNIVISTAHHAAWEKFFRFFDVSPILVRPSLLQQKMAVDPQELVKKCNDKTIGVVAILGNHYNGVYDPVWNIDHEIQQLNMEKGWQIGIHVDAASGGFIAPFQMPSPPPFDFRLPNVLSMSASGHKFGESICGTGWVIFRERHDLAEHIAVSVTYLGGHCDSITLNFSRPASGPYVQFYKLLRLGKEGYRAKVLNQMNVASCIRTFLKDLKHPNGLPRFQIVDGGNNCCLPVVAARLNPEVQLRYNDIDFHRAISTSHWYVSGYSLSFHDLTNGCARENICTDVGADATMFRIVCKSNLTRILVQDLMVQFIKTLDALDSSTLPSYHSFESYKEEKKSEPSDEEKERQAMVDDSKVTALPAWHDDVPVGAKRPRISGPGDWR